MPTQEELQAAADAFNKPPPPRKEPSKEDELAKMMRQIEEMESEKPLAQADGDSGLITSQPAAQAQSPLPLGSGSEVATLPPVSPASPSPAPPIDLQKSQPGYEYLGTLPQAQPPPKPPPAPEWLHSIAEVISKESRHYGVLFKLGDIKSGKAHGYILKERAVPEFITVPADAILLHGKARVKSKGCCSPQWMSENKE